jgi:hypothetical protein
MDIAEAGLAHEDRFLALTGRGPDLARQAGKQLPYRARASPSLDAPPVAEPLVYLRWITRAAPPNSGVSALT